MDDMIELSDGRDIPDLSASLGWKVPMPGTPDWSLTGLAQEWTSSSKWVDPRLGPVRHTVTSE